MPIPTWVTGQVLSASDVNSWFVPIVVLKASNTTRASNTSPTSDPDLVLPLAASATYIIDGAIFYDGANQSGSQAAQGGMQWQFAIPSGATGREQAIENVNGSALVSALAWTTTFNGDTTGIVAGGNRGLWIRGMITTTNAGNLTFQWAQTVSSAFGTSVYALSHLRAQRIA